MDPLAGSAEEAQRPNVPEEPKGQGAGRSFRILKSNNVKGLISYYLFKTAVRVQTQDNSLGFVTQGELCGYLSKVEKYNKTQAKAIATLAIQQLRKSAKPSKTHEVTQTLMNCKLHSAPLNITNIPNDLEASRLRHDPSITLQGINQPFNKQIYEELTQFSQPIRMGEEEFLMDGKQKRFIDLYKALTKEALAHPFPGKRDRLQTDRAVRHALASMRDCYDDSYDQALTAAYPAPPYVLNKLEHGSHCWFEIRDGAIYAYKTVNYSVNHRSDSSLYGLTAYTRCTKIHIKSRQTDTQPPKVFPAGDVEVQPTQWGNPPVWGSPLTDQLKQLTVSDEAFGNIQNYLETTNLTPQTIKGITQPVFKTTWGDFIQRTLYTTVDEHVFFRPDRQTDNTEEFVRMFNQLKQLALEQLPPTQPNKNDALAEQAVHIALAAATQAFDPPHLGKLGNFLTPFGLIPTGMGLSLSDDSMYRPKVRLQIRDQKIYVTKTIFFAMKPSHNVEVAVGTIRCDRCTSIDIETGRNQVEPTVWQNLSITTNSSPKVT